LQQHGIKTQGVATLCLGLCAYWAFSPQKHPGQKKIWGIERTKDVRPERAISPQPRAERSGTLEIMATKPKNALKRAKAQKVT